LIKELINEFFEEVKYKEPSNFQDLWKKVVGKKLALETDNIRFKNDTLYVIVRNAYVKSDLISKRQLILRKIESLNSNISKISFD